MAAIGIGSNSLRMLVADIGDAQLSRLLRDREGLRVFAALDEKGNISQEMLNRACESVNAMKQKALALGAQTVHLFATSAVRDAHNQQAFQDQLKETTGLELEICSGDREAALSFLGATGPERSGMIDIGGGSTEIVIGRQDRMEYAESLQMGAVRLFREQPITSELEAYQVVERAARLLTPEKERILSLSPAETWYGVGGTFTTAAALVQDIPWTDRERIGGFVITRRDVRRVMEQLAALPIEQRLQLRGLQPQRADIVVHGLAILLCCMETLRIDGMTVSECGNLEGYLKQRYLPD